MEYFYKHLEQYDENKVESAMKVLMKQLAATLSRQQGIRYHPCGQQSYFGHLSQQLRSKGGSTFQVISDRLVLKTSSDLAFGNEGANMLKDKELKAKQKEVHQNEADFSKSQKEIMKAKLALTDSEADKLARDLAKN